jgi:L-threonylcarbamoyladenylate synthase
MRLNATAISPIIDTLRNGGIGVMPTDTIYGIVGSALNKNTVRRIYLLRKRNPKKPMIVLVAAMRDVERFGVVPNAKMKKILKRVWPGPVSVILPVKKFRYLTRGTKTLAFRLPKPAWLSTFLRKTGPLVAPSANFEGKRSARTIREAKRYFGDSVQFYIDAGRLNSQPSTILRIEKRKVSLVRQGSVGIDRI